MDGGIDLGPVSGTNAYMVRCGSGAAARQKAAKDTLVYRHGSHDAAGQTASTR